MTAKVAMLLAEKGESQLVKFAWVDIPFLSNHYFRDEGQNWLEKAHNAGRA
jgi:hypothetical protein